MAATSLPHGAFETSTTAAGPKRATGAVPNPDAMAGRVRRFLDVLFGEGGATPADPRDLFEITTAWVTLETNGYETVDRAGLCFSNVESVDFDAVVRDVEELLGISGEETMADYRVVDDDYGYKWVLISDAMFEDVVADVHMVADTLVEEGYESYLLCAVFAFRGDREVYWLYNFTRGTWYPFAPTEAGTRDEDLEARLRELGADELDVESDRDRQYPLWGIPF